jgi:hypothetical protein
VVRNGALGFTKKDPASPTSVRREPQSSSTKFVLIGPMCWDLLAMSGISTGEARSQFTVVNVLYCLLGLCRARAIASASRRMSSPAEQETLIMVVQAAAKRPVTASKSVGTVGVAEMAPGSQTLYVATSFQFAQSGGQQYAY